MLRCPAPGCTNQARYTRREELTKHTKICSFAKEKLEAQMNAARKRTATDSTQDTEPNKRARIEVVSAAQNSAEGPR